MAFLPKNIPRAGGFQIGMRLFAPWQSFHLAKQGKAPVQMNMNLQMNPNFNF